MSLVYTPAQTAAAKADWDYWRGKLAGENHAAALVGNNDGEDSFNDKARGDKDTAGGLSQWHGARRNLILTKTNIDVWDATPEKQREAMFAEMTAPWSSYRHVWTLLMAAETVEAAVTVLVVHYEQSASETRDIARRSLLANYWLDQFGSAAS